MGEGEERERGKCPEADDVSLPRSALYGLRASALHVLPAGLLMSPFPNSGATGERNGEKKERGLPSFPNARKPIPREALKSGSRSEVGKKEANRS